MAPHAIVMKSEKPAELVVLDFMHDENEGVQGALGFVLSDTHAKVNLNQQEIGYLSIEVTFLYSYSLYYFTLY